MTMKLDARIPKQDKRTLQSSNFRKMSRMEWIVQTVWPMYLQKVQKVQFATKEACMREEKCKKCEI
jgi:hypothetical protein